MDESLVSQPCLLIYIAFAEREHCGRAELLPEERHVALRRDRRVRDLLLVRTTAFRLLTDGTGVEIVFSLGS